MRARTKNPININLRLNWIHLQHRMSILTRRWASETIKTLTANRELRFATNKLNPLLGVNAPDEKGRRESALLLGLPPARPPLMR